MKPKEDLTGKSFNRWTVVQYDQEGSDKCRRSKWICRCQCGNIKSVLQQGLKNGTSQSCGCWNKERDRTYSHGKQINYQNGEIINGFKIIEQDLSKLTGNKKPKWWKVECPYCGRVFSLDGRDLRYGSQKSCGCIKSKGELKISQILTQENIKYQTQYTFQDFPKRKFDFAIFDSDGNLLYLIEYDGIQHFDTSSKYYSEEGVARDMEKNNYCKSNGIKLYRISYLEYENIRTTQDLLNPKFLIR